MPFTLGPWELIIILMIVVVIFGAGRISEIGGALGKGIKEFRSATKDESSSAETPVTDSTTTSAVVAPANEKVAANGKVATSAPAAPASEVKCQSCGTANPTDRTFCGQCGTKITVRAA